MTITTEHFSLLTVSFCCCDIRIFWTLLLTNQTKHLGTVKEMTDIEFYKRRPDNQMLHPWMQLMTLCFPACHDISPSTQWTAGWQVPTRKQAPSHREPSVVQRSWMKPCPITISSSDWKIHQPRSQWCYEAVSQSECLQLLFSGRPAQLISHNDKLSLHMLYVATVHKSKLKLFPSLIGS